MPPQVLASVKALPAAARSLKAVFNLPAAQAAQESTGGEDDEREEEAENEGDLNLDDYCQPVEGDPMLSDHPDVRISPIVLYKIKQAKEELRTAQRKAALMAEGLDEREVAERMEMEAAAGGGGGGRQNPLALLISVGARVEATGGSDSADAQALNERRRLQRNIDGFFSKMYGIEKLRAADLPNKRTRDASGQRIKSAHEIAKETAMTPVGGLAYQREVDNMRFAADARTEFRQYEAERKRLAGPEKHEATRRQGMNSTAAPGGMSDFDALAAIRAEMEEGGGGDDDDEGEEGDEGDEDEEADLAA